MQGLNEKVWERLDARSEKALVGVDPRLAGFFKDHIRPAAICAGLLVVVTEGMRTEARQRQYYKAGVSMTLQSKHLVGKAIDIALFLPDGSGTYKPAAYNALAAILSEPMRNERITWGGHWPKLRDYCHFELT